MEIGRDGGLEGALVVKGVAGLLGEDEEGVRLGGGVAEWQRTGVAGHGLRIVLTRQGGTLYPLSWKGREDDGYT